MEAKYIIFLIIVLSSLSLLDCNNSSNDKISNKLTDINETIINNQKINNKEISDKKTRRKLYEERWENLKIMIDLTNFYNRTNELGLGDDKKAIFIRAINKAKNNLESFIKIKNDDVSLDIDYDKLEEFELNQWDPLYFPLEEKSYTKTNFDYNFVIFFRFAELSDPENMASSKIVFIKDIPPYVVPLMGVITIKQNFPDDKIKENYLEALMLHEFTHLLGFYFDDDFPFSGIIEMQGSKYYVTEDTAPTVIDYANKYFGCSNNDPDKITEIELEKDADNNLHWPSKYFLGEYMTKFNYLEEQVISGFTLAFFEDLGYLQVEGYYTGGLMRFGKNKGCNFIKNKCINDQKIYNNEFYQPVLDPNNDPINAALEPSCSSGRLSRTIYQLKSYTDDLPTAFRYFSDPKIGSISSIADYCPISLYSSETPLFSGRCSSKGVIDDEVLSNKIGESLSDRSFCALSSMVKDADSDLANDVRAVCFEMYCSDESLTIKFGTNDFFVCPREGGKIQGFQGFQGFILCPDYNLICTGLGTQTQTDICNDMFDCITKKVKEKEIYDDYYNYAIQTTQIPFQYNDQDYPISKRGELSTNKNTCPKFCSHCDTNKICKKCAAN